MAKPLRPFVRGGGYYPSKKWIPLVRNGGYTTQNGGETEPVWATASGAIASFTTPFAYPLKKLMAEINPVQDLHGQSSPYPAGGGKNKCDGIAYDGAISSNIPRISSKTPVASPHSISTGFGGVCFFAKVESGNTYALSSDETGASQTFYWAIYSSLDDALNITNALQSGSTNVSFTAEHDGYVLFMRYNTTAGTSVAWTYAQAEVGSSATAYAPYSNECPISGWTGLQGQRTGVNVFDQSNVLDFYVGGVGGTTVGVGGTLVAMPVKKGVTYTINGTIGNRSGLYYTYLSPSEISYGVVLELNPGYQFLAAFPFTFTAHDTCTLCFYVNTDWDQTIADSIYAVVGSSAETYTPYTGEPISVSFGRTVYGGSDEVVGGNGTSTMGMVDLGTLTWTAAGTNTSGKNRYYAVVDGVKRVGSNSEKANFKCSSYGVETPNGTYLCRDGISGSVETDRVFIYDSTKDTLTGSEFKAAMSGVQLCYELATPTTFTHTGQSVSTLVGQNNVWVTSGDAEVTYRIE